MTLAPIGVSVYTRIVHFKKCIESLKKNTLAEKSELFIYSDAASKIEDDKLVQEVREYSHNIEGFKKIYLIERESNFGGTHNANMAYKEITKKYGKSIFLEDDIVTAPGFLTYMNEALEFYKGNEYIFSITGYSPPIELPEDYKEDIFTLQRFNGWGQGIWQESIESVPSKIKLNEFKKLKKKRKTLSIDGEDVLGKIYNELNEIYEAEDVRFMYYQLTHNKVTVYPRKSLVQNIGHDGTGVRCSKNNKFIHNELWTKTNDFYFKKNIIVNENIRLANYNFRSIGISGKIVILIKQLGLYPLMHRLMVLYKKMISREVFKDVFF